jgi:hypothetical protein
MEPGFILDRGHYSVPSDQRWVEGVPQHSIWTGVKTKGRDVYAVTSYRCQRCGYLESYATEPSKV